MSDKPDWLPPLVLLHDYSGNWHAYLDVLYAWFKQDFIDDKPVFLGRRLGLKRHPMIHNKEATFWHFIQEGPIENDRTLISVDASGFVGLSLSSIIAVTL